MNGLCSECKERETDIACADCRNFVCRSCQGRHNEKCELCPRCYGRGTVVVTYKRHGVSETREESCPQCLSRERVKQLIGLLTDYINTLITYRTTEVESRRESSAEMAAEIRKKLITLLP